ncbi:helix-turn-helix domain-containing protein [Streptomyces sp. NPDC014006]|uniref:helix-turn-helix domain-containing protein n=1 Tax=Streptomyces sp. NPDC014006 TaxID=3364870 RepID=UPI0036FA6327
MSALFTKEPSQVKMTTLAALCTALECTPNDLIEVDTTPVERPITPPRPVAEVPQAASARGRSSLPCDRRRPTWAKDNGTASPAADRSTAGHRHFPKVGADSLLTGNAGEDRGQAP